MSVIENLLDLLSSMIDEALVETENLSGISEGSFIPRYSLGVKGMVSLFKTGPPLALISLYSCRSGSWVHLKSDCEALILFSFC